MPDKLFLEFGLKALLQGKPIQVFGDGEQRRDYNFVDDVIDALLLSATAEDAVGKAFNLEDRPLSLKETAKLMCNQIEDAEFEMIPFRKTERQLMSVILFVITVHFQILLDGSPRSHLKKVYRSHWISSRKSLSTT